MTRILLSIAVLLLACPLRAGVVINEYLSNNETGIVDEDGDRTDWIELYNSGPAAVGIDGYSLTDDPLVPRKWLLPDISLLPGEPLLIFASGKDRRIWARHWETVIHEGDIWRYGVWTSPPPADWFSPGYDDSDWDAGPSGFGNADGDDATQIPPSISCHIRREFLVESAAEVSQLFLHVDYDDGFVAYLNGVEIARANLGAAGVPPAFDLPAGSQHEAWIYRGGLPEGFLVPSPEALLHDGVNLLAIEVHNAATEWDMSLTPFLTLGLDAPPAGGGEGVPEILQPLIPNLHCNFSLDNAGEPIILSNTNGVPLDQAEIGPLPADLSRGRLPDGGASWYLFDAPTPGESNAGAQGWEGIAPEPEFSLTAGFYGQAITLALSDQDPLANIYYTLDGSIPGDLANPSSFAYLGAFAVDSCTAVRARAFLPNHLPSPIATASYFIGESFTLPVVSLATDPANLWDPEIGIYVMGDSAEAQWPYYGANFWQDWERPVHFEYFDESGSLGVELDAGMQIHGGTSRAFPQKSLRIEAKDLFGPESIDYPFFGPDGLSHFKRLILRNSGQDFPRTHCRDGLATRIASDSQLELMDYEPAIVFINGEYWGIQDIRERPDKYYLEDHFGVDPDSVDILESECSPMEGNCDDWESMIDFIDTNGASAPWAYNYVKLLMDTDDFAEYNVFETFLTNLDWPQHNLRRWQPQAEGGRWRWVFLDLDAALGADIGPEYNGLHYAADDDGYPPLWSTYLLRRLLESPQFRTTFIDAYADHLNSSFLPSRTLPLLDAVTERIAPEVPRHRERWDLPVEDWATEVDIMRDFLTARPAYAWQQLASELDLGDTFELTLDIEPPGAGSIKLTAVSVDSLWTGRYFLGVPVHLKAQAAPGYRFTGWSDPTLPPWPEVFITPGADYALSARFEVYLSSPVVINEINYNSNPAVNPEDWVELLNADTKPRDLSGWVFKDDDDSHAFVFPPGTYIMPGEYLVLCRNLSLFHGVFPEVTTAIGDMDFGFNGSGELLRLYNPNGNLIDTVNYDDAPPWPVGPDGQGPTLELRDSEADNALAVNWAASTGHGTPGAANSAIPTEAPGESTIPAVVSLERPFPNPFNPRTQFAFGLPAAGPVSLRIYDVLGRCVATPLDETRPAGWHRVIWEARDLASGVYFAQLRAGGETRTRKLLLVK